MIIQQDGSNATYQIQRYLPGEFWINQQKYEHSIIIQPHRLTPWPPRDLSEIKPEHFAPIFEASPHIVLLGTGSQLIIPSEELLLPLFKRGLGVEFMDSRAACHTFTVLAAEERDVLACILIK